MANGEIRINVTQDNTNNFGFIRVEQEGQMDVRLEQESFVTDLDVAIINGTAGLTEIEHTEDLSGKGTSESPLGISDSFKEVVENKQDKITVGPGLVLDDQNHLTLTNSYVFEQGVPSNLWVIHHNLNKMPTVVIVDTSGNVVEASVLYNDLDTCTVSMKYMFKGTAYLN